MNLPKPLRALVALAGLYAVLVPLLHYGRNGMSWAHSPLVALVAAPVALLLSRLRGHGKDRARAAGRRWRERSRRRGDASAD